MAINWTKDQRKAIDVRNKDILVSAAAGSGKTAALTERVITLLTDENDPCGIENLLIVTFTRASAAELKEKIRKKLSENLSKSTKKEHLRRQLAALPSAKISTVHSFCGALVREYASSLSLPTGMRIADDMEAELLYRQTIEETVHDAFEKAPPFDDGFDFEHIADNFLKSKTDSAITELLLDTYKKLLNSPKRLDLLIQSAEYHRDISKNGFENSIYFDGILKKIEYHYTYFRDRILYIADHYGDDDDYKKKCSVQMSSDLDYVNIVLAAVSERDYIKIKNALTCRQRTNLGRMDDSVEFKKLCTDVRSKIKKQIDSLTEYFGFSPDELKEYSEECAILLEGIHRILSVADKRLSQKKISRKMLDYSDMEHYAYRLLRDPETDEPTPLARKISGELKEVMVDEYQDTNELQDGIFSAIGVGKRFMVGDIKQSIYSFRGAVPQLFADYRKKFSGDDENEDTLFFSNNFRCSEPIVKLTNDIFSALFPLNEAVPYEKQDELVFSKAKGETCHEDEAKFILISDREDCDPEAIWVAEKISSLLKSGVNENGEKYKPSDFAILMRNKGAISEYINELNARGIPANSSDDGDLFESPEIRLLTSLLNVIDNPINDIYLAATMKSPFFSFTLDELITLRRENNDRSLYETVKVHAEQGNEKCEKLLDTLSRYRYISRSMPIDKFISFLYKDMNIVELICATDNSEHSEIKKANLHLFYEYARKFEHSSFKGLYNFVSYLNDIINSEKSLPSAKSAEQSLCGVQIMTIHKSKGLEFPVCFICECGKNLLNTDAKSLNYSRKYQFALKHKSNDGLTIHKLPMHTLVYSDNRESEFFDELRILYVALTRAKQKLFICGKTKKDLQEFVDDNLGREPADNYTLRTCSTGISLLLNSLSHSTCPIELYEEVTVVKATDTVCKNIQFNIDGSLKAELQKRLSFIYPHKAVASIPKKISVSKLYPGILDENDQSEEETQNISIPFVLPEPDPSDELAARRGTATHAFMQFCDMNNAEIDIDTECRRLISDGFIPESFDELLYKKELEWFFKSKLYNTICHSPNVWREYRFNIGLSASLFTDSSNISADEKLYVQGVIDCFYEEPDGTLTVIDYKTDRVYGKDPEAVQAFIDRHKDQLKYYAIAIEQITSKKVGKKLLYSFSMGKSIEV